MNNLYIKYILLLLVYVPLQVLILNQIMFSSYINPFLYILLIIILPIKTSKWFLLIYSFILGFFIDLFSSSLGFHSTACVLIAFLKPLINRITIPHNILGDTDRIILQKIGIKSYITFSYILILIHHTCLFLLEHLNFSLLVFSKIIASSIITLIIILIAQLFISNKK